MSAISQPPIQLPTAARFGHGTAVSRPVRFGNEGPAGPAGAEGIDDSENLSTHSPQSGLGKLIRDTFSQHGLIQGARQFADTLRHIMTWNQVLEEVAPESSYPARLLTVLDIAYARFREGFQSKNGETPTDEVNFKLYQNVLKRFPGLALMDAAELPLDMISQIADASGDPEGVRVKLDEIRKAYQEGGQPSADDLKAELESALDPASA